MLINVHRFVGILLLLALLLPGVVSAACMGVNDACGTVSTCCAGETCCCQIDAAPQTPVEAGVDPVLPVIPGLPLALFPVVLVSFESPSVTTPIPDEAVVRRPVEVVRSVVNVWTT
jgi:hypothetical protein